MNRPESIALVDISYLFKRRYHTIGNETPMAAAKAVLGDLERLAKDVAHLIVCRDAPPYSHRTAIFADYKAHRPAPEPEEIAQKRWLWEELKRTPFNVAWSQGYEADDIIATLASKYGEWCRDVRIVSSDKDACQCITDNVNQYIPPNGDGDWERRDPQGVLAKFGVFPKVVPLYQALVGDKSDNVPGVKSIGPVKAQLIVNKCQTLEGVQAWLNNGGKATREGKLVADDWDNLVMSLKLVTMETNVELDYEGLLVPRAPEPKQEVNNMDINPQQDGVSEADFEEAVKNFEAEQAKDAETEDHYEEERKRNEEHTEARVAPKSEVVPKPRAVASTALVAPTFTRSKYGIVTASLQPLDLDSAYTLCKWFAEGGLYIKKFKTPAAIFTIIAKARELGLPVTVALDGFHVVEGKPSASADMIRALVERDPNFEYLMPVEMTATRATWRGKHRGHPTYVEYSYTIEEARAAGLAAAGFGGKGNWEKRPQDLLVKTAASKLARLLWPASALGLYCPEEFGYTAADLDEREAA
jgi:5'-3' exonuclease